MAYTEFYCNASTGHNNNGGSDENASPSYTHTNGGWNSGTGVYTPTSGDPSASGVSVGQFASVFNDGSPTTAVFIGRVTAVSSTTITISTTAKSGTAPTTNATGRSINVGGVWKGPNGSANFPFNFAAAAMANSSAHPVRVNLKNNAQYDITAGITHSLNGSITFQGYSSSAGDLGKATIDGGATGSSYVLLTCSGGGSWRFADLIFANNGNSGTSSGINGASLVGVIYERVVVHDVRGSGFVSTYNHIECEAYACGKGGSAFGFNGTILHTNCISHDNTGSGFSAVASFGQGSYYQNCIADSNSAHGFVLSARSSTHIAINCDAYNNTTDGFRLDTSVSGPCWILMNCNAVKNGGYGVRRNDSGTDSILSMYNVAFGAGTQANSSGSTSLNANTGLLEIGTANYASDAIPWVDAPNGDFRINLAASKGAGRGEFTQTAASYSGTVGYPDIGAAQHQDAGGSGPVGRATIIQNIGTY